MSEISDAERRQLQTLRKEKSESILKCKQLKRITELIVKAPFKERANIINSELRPYVGQQAISLLSLIIRLPISNFFLRYIILAVLIPAYGVKFCLDFIDDLQVNIKRFVNSILQGVYDELLWVSKKAYQQICYLGSTAWQGACWVCTKIKQFWNWLWN